MMKKIGSCCLLFALVALSQMSCLEEPPMLNNQDKKLIDSLYNVERKAMTLELDSICDVEFDSRVQSAVDSIMEKRLEEIRRLKGRGQK